MKKVITYGTFDLFHKGHYNILKRAKEYGDKLYVGVTGNVYDFERGKMEVIDSLETRISNVKNTGFADVIFVEEYLGQKISDIQNYGIDVLVIGADWKGKFDYLNKFCEVVYLPRTKDISSTDLRRENVLDIGMITGSEDEDFFSELHYLATLHPKAVCCKKEDLLKRFKQKHNVDTFTYDSKRFYNELDVVYINSKKDQAKYVENAINNKTHVITEILDLDRANVKHLYSKAKENKVLLIENLCGIYSRNWNQLLWMLNTGMIGKLKNVNISVESSESNILPLIIFFLTKVLNGKFENIAHTGFLNYTNITFNADGCIVHIQCGDRTIVKDKFEIIGDKGKLKIASPWQEINYFTISPYDSNEKIQRFSYNVPANWLRHCFADLINNLRQQQYFNKKFNVKDGTKIDAYLNKINREQ
jgi:glycerol-3-phosphate cytidylyltransferase